MTGTSRLPTVAAVVLLASTVLPAAPARSTESMFGLRLPVGGNRRVAVTGPKTGRRLVPIALGLALAMAQAGTSHALGPSLESFAKAQNFNNSFTTNMSSSGGLVTAVGDIGEASAFAGYGLLRGTSHTFGFDQIGEGESDSIARFVDFLTINSNIGATGQFSASLGLTVDGRITTTNPDPAITGAGVHIEITTDIPGGTPGNFGNLFNFPSGSYNAVVSTNFVFNYGETFELIGFLETIAQTCNLPICPTDVNVDFSETALLNQISLPDGAFITSASGTQYPVTENGGTPVPEPASGILLTGSLLGFAILRRRASRLPGLLAADRLPDAGAHRRHVELAHAGERIHHRVDDCRQRADRASFARALAAAG